MLTSLILTESQAIALDFFDSGMSYATYAALYEGSMKNSAIRDLLINAVQAAVDAGLDVAAMGIPLDTAVDAILAIYESSSVINAISAPTDSLIINGTNIVAQLKGITLRDGASAVLNRARSIISSLVAVLKKSGVNVTQALAELAQKMQVVVSKSAEATADWVATMIPDAPGIDIVIANAIKLLADNSYTVIAKAFDTMPKGLQEFFYDPNKFSKAITTIIDKVIDVFKDSGPVDIDKEVQDEKEKSILKKVSGMAFDTAINVLTAGGASAIKGAHGAFKKVIGPKIIDFLQTKIKPKIPAVVKMMQTIVPFTFAIVATAQVIMTEYDVAQPGKASEGKFSNKNLIKEFVALSICQQGMTNNNGKKKSLRSARTFK